MSYFEKLKSKKSYVEVYMENKEKKEKNFTYEKDDERIWKPMPDSMGNSYSVIRFLPRNMEEFEEVNSFVGPVYSHSFQNTNTKKWFIENCPRTIDKSAKCPVCEYNWSMFKNYEKEIAKTKTALTKGKAYYYANIFVVKDNSNPENNGKVFIYKFGKTIMDKIQECLDPKYEEDKAFDPFHPINGANFILKTKRKGGFLNFDDSNFEACSPIVKNSKEFDDIMDMTYSINEFVDPSKFKEYDALKNRFELVMNGTTSYEVQRNFESVVNNDINSETEDEILNFNKSSFGEDDDDILSMLDDKNDLPF